MENNEAIRLKAEPTPEQYAALVAYAKENGRTWKSQLNQDWQTGRASGPLQQVRNTFGPTWLVRFKFKGGKA